MTITESIKFNKLQEENEKLKNQLAEKDKEIMELKNWIQNGGCHQNIQKFIDNLDKEISELKQQQLFKEDFGLTCYAECNCDGDGCGYGLIDNSKYNKLPSKEVK